MKFAGLQNSVRASGPHWLKWHQARNNHLQLIRIFILTG